MHLKTLYYTVLQLEREGGVHRDTKYPESDKSHYFSVSHDHDEEAARAAFEAALL